jgi:thiamine-monophosphate kinase
VPATVADFTERELVARIQQKLLPPPAWLLVGIGDDAAVVEPERNRVEVLTVDCLVEGLHFDRRFVPADAIGHRALAVNLSDLAAMGATPRLALLSLVLPVDFGIDDFDAMLAGLTTLAAAHRVHVVGGNLTQTPGPLTIDVTVVGTVKRRQALTRAGAQPGDDLYVTNSIGTARAALEQLRAGRSSIHADAYLRPRPRLRTGTLLARNRLASACVDLSDGLADGARQISAASAVGVEVDADALPLLADVRDWFTSSGRDPAMAALEGGDDYELLFAARPRHRGRLAAVLRHGDSPVKRIGMCTDRQVIEIRWQRADGVEVRPLPPGYSHFR